MEAGFPMPGMVMLGRDSMMPTADKRAIFGTVTIVEGEHSSQERSFSNLKLKFVFSWIWI